MGVLAVSGVKGAAYGDAFFGGNFLFNRDRLGPDGTYDDAADALDIGHLRYPGGSITEHYFDPSDPDKATAVEASTGRVFELTGFTEFMTWAEDTGRSVTIVLPTARYVGDTRDANGDRFAQIDEDEIRTFVRDTLDGVYGNPRIDAFELGNEYWGTGLSTAEYGRIAARMAQIVQEEIDAHGGAALDQQIDILVQAGHNFGSANLSTEYSAYGTPLAQIEAVIADYGLNVDPDELMYGNGTVAWPVVQNLILLGEIRGTEGFDDIDGVAEHLYSLAPEVISTRAFSLDVLNRTWGAEIPGLELHVTEWNVATQSPLLDRNEDYGLKAAQEMLQMTEAMQAAGVDATHFWPVQQNTPNDLTGNEGQTPLTVQGEMFRMMRSSLEGTRPVGFQGADWGETEVRSEGALLHGFYAPDRMVFFVTAGQDGAATMFDAGGLFDGHGAVSVTRLGVPEGMNPTAASTPAQVETLDPQGVLVDGELRVDLDPWEILQVVIENPLWTTTFLDATSPDAPAPVTLPDGNDWQAGDDPGLPPMTNAPPTDQPPDDPDDGDPDADLDTGDDGGGMGGMGLILLLPLLLLGGIGG